MTDSGLKMAPSKPCYISSVFNSVILFSLELFPWIERPKSIWFWRYLTRGLIWHLSQSSIRPSIYFSSIVTSRSNPFLEPPVLSNKGKVSCSRKQRRPLMWFEPVTDTLLVSACSWYWKSFVNMGPEKAFQDQFQFCSKRAVSTNIFWSYSWHLI